MKPLLHLLYAIAFPTSLFSQALLQNACESNPCYPIPICGTNTVIQPNSFISTGNPQAICGANVFSNNWVYYQIHCYGSGNLKFTLTPNDPVSDLNYALFNTTTTSCSSLLSTTDCNAANSVGAVSSPTIPISVGNTYLLGVQRAYGGTTQTGFTISFNGTTAMLDDNIHPILDTLLPFNLCASVTQLTVVMNKPILCAQISANDFSIAGSPSFTAQGVTCPGCVNTTVPLINISNFTDTVIFNFSSALSPGNYSIKFNSASSNLPSDACGHLPQFTDSLNFQIYPPLTLTYQTGFDCSSLTYTDTLMASGGNAPYLYKVAGGSQLNVYTPNTIYSGLQGGLTYTLAVKDANGCMDSVTHSPVVVMPMMPLNLSLSASPPCYNQFADDSITVTGFSSGMPPYTFTLTSTPASAAASGTFYPPATWKNLTFTTGASFTVTVTDAMGCTKTGVKNLINPNPMLLSITNVPNICSNDSDAVITSMVSGGTPPWLFEISPSYIPPMTYSNTNWSMINNIVSHVPNGVYTIQVTDANGCTFTTTHTVGSFNQSPNPQITLVSNMLTAQSGFSSYQWYYNGAPIAGATASTYLPTQFGSYTVLVSNANATCSAMSAPFVFLATSLANPKEESIQVWPNPVQQILHLNQINPLSTLEVRSVDGRILSHLSKKAPIPEILDFSSLHPGIYFLIFRSEQETKFIKICKE